MSGAGQYVNNPQITGLAVRQLCAWFEDGEEQVQPVFWGVSIDVQPGCILGVAGPNGSGKTTLIRSIMGLHQSRTGEVRVNGQPVSTTRIGMIPQAYAESLFPWASLCTNIEMVAGASRATMEEMLEECSITLNLDLRPYQCSGGMNQQAVILRAMVCKPGMLVADEPFSALDIHTAAKVRRALRRHVQHHEIPMIVVSHDLVSMVELCDSVLVIPGTPYTTAKIEGYASARVIDNESGAREASWAGSEESASFVDTISRLLRRA